MNSSVSPEKVLPHVYSISKGIFFNCFPLQFLKPSIVAGLHYSCPAILQLWTISYSFSLLNCGISSASFFSRSSWLLLWIKSILPLAGWPPLGHNKVIFFKLFNSGVCWMLKNKQTKKRFFFRTLSQNTYAIHCIFRSWRSPVLTQYIILQTFKWILNWNYKQHRLRL